MTASQDVAAALDDPAVATYDHETVLDLMSGAVYACMTPGLGNIYDAAATDVPTLWLPPVNDTHPRQVGLLRDHGCCDAHLDWAHIGHPVDYDAPIPDILAAVTRVVRQVSKRRCARDLLTARLRALADGLGPAPGRARKLTDRFGQDGTRHAATALLGCAGGGQSGRSPSPT
ncbi:hypothetical protein ACQEU5_21500 [Marinactinospora thermotolerans]|uniref:hypothetical protein n=1 Tax=Marinactinospora thermotolerans TaxID=531310 RepID=UPI0011855ADD|nr:hypothetical protein [Marinactinospora thermotolerans]